MTPARDPSARPSPATARRVAGAALVVVGLATVLVAGGVVAAGATPDEAAPASAPVQGPPPAPSSGAATRALAPRTPWSWPVAAPHPVVRPFVAPEQPWSPGHRGIDVGAAPGSVVTAPDDGVVRFAGTVVDRPVLSIIHADGLVSSLEPVTAAVSAGDPVARGETVGVVVAGHSPDVDAVHLGARLDGEYVSPLLFLGGGRPSVLLPTRPLG